MKYLKNFFSNPYFLALIPFIVIILLIHNGFQRYLLEIESSVTLTNDSYYWFDDLDNDGSSEQISAVNQPNSTGIAISTDNGIIEQFSFKGNFNFLLKECLFINGDKDNDGTREIYVFTLSGDSVLLHSISDFRHSQVSFRNRFISKVGPGLKIPDPFIIPAEMEDLDSDGIKELIFGIGSGYSGYPRRVYAYNISKDSLIISPESSYYIWKIMQTDITGDGKREIIPYGYAITNVSPEKAKYHDFSSFLMVLDQDLEFLFPPVEFRGKYSKVTPFVKETEKGNSLGFLFNPASGLARSTIYYSDAGGVITDSVPLPFYSVDCLNTSFRDNKNMYLMAIPKNKISLVNDRFEQVKTLSPIEIYSILQKDFNRDGRNEILITHPSNGKITIYREGLYNPVSAQVNFQVHAESLISLKVSASSDPLISLQSGQNHYMLKYRQNPAYPYYYLLYPGIYSAILGFVLIIRNIQKNQLKKKYDNEKKISQLQLALIKNQLDPHFTLNVINAIIYSIEYADRRQAGDQLRQFASLYRNMLLSASSIQRTIGEEIDFCDEYLSLEKMRFGDKFNYKISVSDDINRNKLIPKLLIQIHVENAVKHGLSYLNEGGMLNINLKKADSELLIEIIDNGIGREESGKQDKMTTGKGLEIMNELYLIYNKYYNEKVSSEIIDQYHPNGKSAGTRVIIRIHNQNESA